MSIVGTNDLGDGRTVAIVDHDPTVVATDVAVGSMIVDSSAGIWYRKLDNGATVNVVRIGPRLYDAVVATVGGDYKTVGAALAAGNQRIFVRNGTYVETGDLTIPSAGCLVGESPGSVILAMAGAFSVRFDGSGRQTLAGTITVTNGSFAVVGVGTSFTSLLPGDYILVDSVWHQIATITNATNLALVNAYQGVTAAGLAMRGQSMSVGGCLQNVLVIGAGAECLEMIQALRCQVQSCAFRSGGVAATTPTVRILDSGLSILNGVAVEFSLFTGIRITSSQGIAISKVSVNNCDGNGIWVTSCLSAVLSELFVQQNDGIGIFLDGTSNRCAISNTIVTRNTGKGIETDPATLSSVISDCIVGFNGGVGIDIDGASNVVDGCVVESNSGGGFFSGDGAVISNCIVKSNTGIGIDLDSDSDCTIVGNIVSLNTGPGISDPGSDNVIANNQCFSNGGDGILVEAASVNSLVIGNRCGLNTLTGITVESGATGAVIQDNRVSGNTVDSIVDAGTNTLIAVQELIIDADTFELPVNSAWAVTVLAPIVTDSVDADIPVALLDDTTEEGFGFSTQIPPNVTKIRLTFWSRCLTAPSAPNLNVGPRLYTQQIIGDSTAVGAWSAATALTTIVFPAGATGANFLKSVMTLSLSTLGLVVGRKYKFEITRNPGITDDVVGDWVVSQVKVAFF